MTDAEIHALCLKPKISRVKGATRKNKNEAIMFKKTNSNSAYLNSTTGSHATTALAACVALLSAVTTTANWQLDSSASAGYINESGEGWPASGAYFDGDSSLGYSITTNEITVSGYATAYASAAFQTWQGSLNRTAWGWASGIVIGKWNWTGAPGAAPSVTANISLGISGHIAVAGGGANTYFQPGRSTAANATAYVQAYTDIESSSSYNSAYGSASVMGWHESRWDCFATAGNGPNTTLTYSDSYYWMDVEMNGGLWESEAEFEILSQPSYQTSSGVASVEAYVSVYTNCDVESDAITPVGVLAEAYSRAESEVSGFASVQLDF